MIDDEILEGNEIHNQEKKRYSFARFLSTLEYRESKKHVLQKTSSCKFKIIKQYFEEK